jgi:hypothetical protein
VQPREISTPRKSARGWRTPAGIHSPLMRMAEVQLRKRFETRDMRSRLALHNSRNVSKIFLASAPFKTTRPPCNNFGVRVDLANQIKGLAPLIGHFFQEFVHRLPRFLAGFRPATTKTLF